MRPLQALVTILLLTALSCSKKTELIKTSNSGINTSSSLEVELRRFLKRTAPEPSDLAKFEQEASENRTSIITRRNKEERLKTISVLPGIQDYISINGVIKSRGGSSPKFIKGIWIFVWQASPDIKFSKGRSTFLSLSQVDELIEYLDFEKSFLDTVKIKDNEKVSNLKTFTPELEFSSVIEANSSSINSKQATLSIFCREAEVRIKKEEIATLKQYINNAKAWAISQSDDVAMFAAKSAAQQ